MDKAMEKWELNGPALLITALMLAAGNFVAVLDTTIANVSVAHIAGGLGASNSQGTWVITSYAVAEAIMVPLTGWRSPSTVVPDLDAAGIRCQTGCCR